MLQITQKQLDNLIELRDQNPGKIVLLLPANICTLKLAEFETNMSPYTQDDIDAIYKNKAQEA